MCLFFILLKDEHKLKMAPILSILITFITFIGYLEHETYKTTEK